jgi:hypothetical protein
MMEQLERYKAALNREKLDRIPVFSQSLEPRIREQVYQKYHLDDDEDDIPPEVEEKILYYQVEKSPPLDLTVASLLEIDLPWVHVPGRSIGHSHPVEPEKIKAMCEKNNKLKYWKHSHQNPKSREKGADPNNFIYNIRNDGKVRQTTRTVIDGKEWVHTYYIDGILSSIEDYEKWIGWTGEMEVMHELARDYDKLLEHIYTVEGKKENGVVPVPTWAGYSEGVRESMGYANFLRAYKKNPKWVKEILIRKAKTYVPGIRQLCGIPNLPMFMSCDDIGAKGSPFYSPKMFKEVVQPALEVLVTAAHEGGKLFYLHTDGYTFPLMQGMINAGVDGHESLEPISEPKATHESLLNASYLRKIKQKFGQELGLIGNIDVSTFLPYANPKDMALHTLNTLKAGSPGGGFILSGCTNYTDACSLDNIAIMHKTAREFQVPEEIRL